MCIIKTILKLVAPVPKVDKYQNYLFVGPHPDDIEIGAGSTVAKLTAEGKKVSFLICTDGRYGTEDENMDLLELIKIRQKESLAAAKVLGVNDVTFLPFSDGGMYSVEELEIEILKVIARVKPDVILAPDYQLMNECHPDHIKTGTATTYAYIACPFYHIMKNLGINETAKPQVLAYYFTAKPNTYVKTGKHYSKMIESLHCYKSQFPIEDDKDNIFKGFLLYLRLRALRYGLRKLTFKADGFRAMANLHTHCAPEAEKL